MTIQRLNDHLADPLAGSHDIGRIHRLVRRDQDKPSGAAGRRRQSRFPGAEDIVLDRFVRRLLHQWHMLVRRRMVNNLGTVLLKDPVDPAGVPHRSDQHLQIQLRMGDL